MNEAFVEGLRDHGVGSRMHILSWWRPRISVRAFAKCITNLHMHEHMSHTHWDYGQEWKSTYRIWAWFSLQFCFSCLIRSPQLLMAVICSKYCYWSCCCFYDTIMCVCVWHNCIHICCTGVFLIHILPVSCLRSSGGPGQADLLLWESKQLDMLTFVLKK